MGVKVSVTDVEPPAATVPLVALAVKHPSPVLSPLHVRVLLPLLLMVSVVVALVPTCTSPNAIVPDSPMTRVDVGVGVGEGVGVWVGVGVVGEEELPPEQELVTAPPPVAPPRIRLTTTEPSPSCWS